MRGLKVSKTEDMSISVHTGEDLDLVMTSLSINPPSPNITRVDVPLGNGSIDLTEALIGVVTYRDVVGEVSFDMFAKLSEREQKLTDFYNLFNGQRLFFETPDDDTHIRDGRFRIKSVKRGAILNQIEVDIVADPFKIKKTLTQHKGTLTGTPPTLVMEIDHKSQPVIPTIKCSAEVEMKFKDKTVTINAGETKTTGLILDKGLNVITFTGALNTSVELIYRELVL